MGVRNGGIKKLLRENKLTFQRKKEITTMIKQVAVDVMSVASGSKKSYNVLRVGTESKYNFNVYQKKFKRQCSKCVAVHEIHKHRAYNAFIRAK